MSYNDITSFNYKRALYKIDTASALKKGIYANLQEFRNNNPSIITGYTVEKGDDDLVQLYLENEDGKPYLSRKCWGYSDGQQCYIMFDGFLFPVLHAGRSFYVWGSKEYNVKNKKS